MFPARSLSIALAVTALLLPACETTQRQQAEKTVMSTEGMIDQLAQTDAEVAATLDSLERVAGEEVNRQASYKLLKRQVKALEAESNRLSGQAMTMKTRSQEYEQMWMQESMTIQDKQLREASKERMDEVKQKMKTVSTQYDQLSSKLDAFKRQVNDVVTYLAADLTPGAIDAAGGEFDKSKMLGEETRKQIDQTQESLRTAKKTMTPMDESKL